MEFKLILLLILFSATVVTSCTDFGYPVDNYVFSARTMDFFIPQDAIIFPVTLNTHFVSLSPINDQMGTSWYSSLGYISFTAYGYNHTVDGMNTCGLTCALLTLIETEYQTVPSDKSNQALQASLICDYVLGQFCNVQDAQTNLSKLYIYRDYLIGKVPMPLIHVSIRDENNNAIVLEIIKGEQIYYNNLISVLTNDPKYDWHIQNNRNYDSINNLASPTKVVINNLEYESYSCGYSSPNTLPYNDSPVSRFVRIAQTIRMIEPASNINYALAKGYNLLSKIEVMPGTTVFPVEQMPSGKMEGMTIYKFIRDHTNRRIYFATYFDPTLRLIELTSMNFSEHMMQIHVANRDTFCTSMNITSMF